MSLASFMIATSHGPTDFVAFPVFTMRRFFHTGIWVRSDAGIENPGDLRGKKVGVPEYQQTANVWTRGVLQHEFGVSPTRHGMLHGTWPRDEPRRRDRVYSAGRDSADLRSGRFQSRRDACRRRAGRAAVLFPARKRRRPQHDRSQEAAGSAHAVRRSGCRGAALLRQDRAVSDQPLHGRAPVDCRARAMGRAEPLRRVRRRAGRERAAAEPSCSSRICRSGLLGTCSPRSWRPTRWRTVYGKTAPSSKRSPPISTSKD